ncbi:putative proline-specific permease [Glarea lozoyensis 74030]|uniref:Putative proline-specific permease n=1 Tax=Glarea lozoyensis (strain ATCC 74030 / MF5533) TaxID=1104152 RepID=H0ESK4_GLAL7|nr:putative proline-specific permease [Glarea lozoyensis 74030]
MSEIPAYSGNDTEKGKYGNDEKSNYQTDVTAGYGSSENLDESEVLQFSETKELRRGLGQRHIQMIALAGTIGTGLFLGSGKALARGGPLGALMGYSFVGVLVTGVVISIAELSALVPLSGAIIRHAEYFVDPALSFAQGWNSIYSSLVSLPAEIVAAAVIVEFWTQAVNSAVWITIFGILLVISNLLFVRVYGELEFGFASLKIMLIIGVNIMNILGMPDLWDTSWDSIQLSQMPSAAETQSPRRNIPIAAKRIFWRVSIFYDLLRSTGTAAQSPFVIASTRAGIKVVPSIINAVVLSSAWSAGNSDAANNIKVLLGSSRTLYGMAREGHAPKIFLRVSRMGVPYVAVAFMSIWMCLGYMTLSDSASTVFSWLQDLVATAALVHWIIICVVYLRFYYGMKKQGIARSALPWAAPFQPYAAWTSLIAFSILLLTGGYITFVHGHWDNETFVSSYINIPIILILYLVYKFIKKTKIIPLDQLPIQKFIDIANANPEEPAKPVVGWRRFNILWS